MRYTIDVNMPSPGSHPQCKVKTTIPSAKRINNGGYLSIEAPTVAQLESWLKSFEEIIAKEIAALR